MNKEKPIIFRFICFTALHLFSVNFSNGQDTIYLKNPSFEDQPHIGSPYAKPIKDWTDCGQQNFPWESSPDIHPVRGYGWGVNKKAHDGKTYLGLVTRYSDTYESISQSLDKPMEAGKCYRISVYLALSEKYSSPTQRSFLVKFDDGRINNARGAPEDFSHPVELFIWGGDDFCRNHKLLARSGPVSNHDWELFDLEFSPKETYQFITIGAYFEKGYKEPYNGHVLVDGLLPIIEIECK